MRFQGILGLLLVIILASGAAAAQSNDVALIEAVKSQDMATARDLVAAGADVNAQDSETMTALHWAAHWGDLELVELLLGEGAEANVSNRYGVTPLHEASLVGNVSMINVLLQAGADPNSAFGSGETAVMTAARTGNIEAVDALLSNGGDVNAAEEWRGQTPLMWAANEGHAEMVQFLIDKGAAVNRRSTILEFGEIATSNGGALMNRPVGGFSPLFFAARVGADEAGQVLIDSGAELDVEEPLYGFSPLEVAIMNGHWDFAAMLIDEGADVQGGALFVAIAARNTPPYTNRPAPPSRDKTYDSLDVIEMLLAAGADPSAVYEHGELPERQAQGAVNVAAGSAPIHAAVSATDAEALRLLLAYGANASAAMRDGTTPLMVVAGKRAPGRYSAGLGPRDDARVDLMKMLVKNGARLDAVVGRSGDTAVHYAARSGNTRFADYLAAMGADLDVENVIGESAREILAGEEALRAACITTGCTNN
jgi:ankyrin repeat protein